ncbi:MAG: hypothetical protein ACF8CY_06185, partial [Gimesia chilikensis]
GKTPVSKEFSEKDRFVMQIQVSETPEAQDMVPDLQLEEIIAQNDRFAGQPSDGVLRSPHLNDSN